MSCIHMIIINILGGLGNQIFQYAFGFALAKKNNTILKLDTNDFTTYKLRNYQLDNFSLKVSIASNKEIKKIKYIKEKFLQKFTRKIRNRKLPFSKQYYQEKQFSFDRAVYDQGSEAYFIGYWQSEKYFLEYRDILLRDFKLKNITKNSGFYTKNI